MFWGGGEVVVVGRWSGSQRETNGASSSLIDRMTEIGFCGSASLVHNKERNRQQGEAGGRRVSPQRQHRLNTCSSDDNGGSLSGKQTCESFARSFKHTRIVQGLRVPRRGSTCRVSHCQLLWQQLLPQQILPHILAPIQQFQGSLERNPETNYQTEKQGDM